MRLTNDMPEFQPDDYVYTSLNFLLSPSWRSKMSNGRIKNENSVFLREALEPLYIQSKEAVKIPLIYTYIGR